MAGTQQQLDARVDVYGLAPHHGRFTLLRLPYEAGGDTVTWNASLTRLPSGSSDVTVMVAVPVPIAVTVRLKPSTNMDTTP